MGRSQQIGEHLATVILSASFAATSLERLPNWKMCVTPSGDRACYDLNDAKKLVIADGQLVLCERTTDSLTACKQTLEAESQKSAEQAHLIAVQGEMIDGLKAENRILQENSSFWGLMTGVGLGFLAGVLSAMLIAASS